MVSERPFCWQRSLLVCLISMLFGSYQFFLQGSTAFMVSELTSDLQTGLTEIGFLSSSFLYTYLLFQLPGGYLADRVNLRVLLVCGCLLMAFACWWFSVAENLMDAMVARGLMGIATSPAIVVSMTLVSRWFPSSWFPAMVGLVESLCLIGGAVGPFILPELIGHIGWRSTMAILSGFGVLLACLVFLLVRSAPSQSFLPADPTPDIKAVSGNKGYIRLIRNADFWLCCLYGFGMFSIMVCFCCLWGVPFIKAQFPANPDQAVWMISLIYLGCAIGAPIMGGVASIMGDYRIVMTLAALSSLILSGCIIYLSCTFWIMATACFLLGITIGGYMLVFTAVKQISPSGVAGLGMAAVNGCLLLGGPVLQPLVGSILSVRGKGCSDALTAIDYQWALLPVIICQLMAFAVTFFLTGRKAVPQ
ncbi:Hexuronate transporter [invertebrate metagenome]|uniref:Hexuronate transporter n=1 Tax=invertebrate metagenome TaxID=1711999 RepID=A0A2H9TBB4_9ZZZZ